MTEQELCQEFRTWAESQGWTVYPEVSFWDMVMLPPKTLPTGEIYRSLIGPGYIAPTEQVAIQAKLQANIAVLSQCLGHHHQGPKYRIVLVKRADTNFIEVARTLGLGVVCYESRRSIFGRKTAWEQGWKVYGLAKPFNSLRPLVLPPIVTNMPAGVQHPKQLSEWRVKALAMCRLLKERPVTSKDFEKAKMSMTIWKLKWLQVDGKEGRLTRYRARTDVRLPDDGWQEYQEELAALK